MTKRTRRKPMPYPCLRLHEELWFLQCHPQKTDEHRARIEEIERRRFERGQHPAAG